MPNVDLFKHVHLGTTKDLFKLDHLLPIHLLPSGQLVFNWKAFLLKIISYFDLNKLIILPPSIQLEFTLTWSSSLSSRLDGLISLWIIFWWCTAEEKQAP